MSSGQDDRYFRYGLGMAIVTVLGFLIGIRWGVMGVAAAYGVVNYLILVPALAYAFKGTSVRVTDFFESIARPALASVAAAGVSSVLVGLAGAGGALWSIAVGSVAFVVSYLGIYVILPGGKRQIAELLSYRAYLHAKFGKAAAG